MKDTLEEYSGIILATISGLTILGIIILLYSTGNPLGDNFRTIMTMGVPK